MTAGLLDRKWAGLSQGDQGTWVGPRRGGLNLPLCFLPREDAPYHEMHTGAHRCEPKKAMW